MKRASLPALALAGLLLAVPARAADAGETVAAGRKLYTSLCARCHGLNLVTSGAIGYDLRTFPKGDKERFVRSVNKGIRAMPAWEGVIKPDQVDAIWAYVGSVNGWGESAGAK
ncbi:MAG: cytochrome c [Burkholderiales bacterium]|jgi:mono/diheme cytochrome c family protein|nr:cytochrome c [Burkholderiales bacterium]